MRSDNNPYQPPSKPRQTIADADSVASRSVTKRRVAGLLFASPIILALPVRYWVFNIAGSWFVSTDLEPDHRAAFLGLMYIPLMMSIAVPAMFAAFLLLWIDRWHPLLTGVLTFVFGALLIPALLFIGIGVLSYLKHG